MQCHNLWSMTPARNDINRVNMIQRNTSQLITLSVVCCGNKGRKYLQKYDNQLAVYCSVVSLLHSKSLIESIKKATITSLLLLLKVMINWLLVAAWRQWHWQLLYCDSNKNQLRERKKQHKMVTINWIICFGEVAQWLDANAYIFGIRSIAFKSNHRYYVTSSFYCFLLSKEQVCILKSHQKVS